ncbi:MAG: hypothetical protein CL678_02180 [Bdellovibrionaceae bacterium]|nr:hypothetical protein [Pseudobdellovibrionaceae bacterium]|tara:strand:- start:19276 stop:19548 length:273 start_codon:yes stop_codon:yes gene_type:complete
MNTKPYENLKESGYLSTTEAAKRLRVGRRALKIAMDATPDWMPRPWFRYAGSEGRPRWHWDAERLGEWWRAVNEYRYQNQREGESNGKKR